MSWVMRREGIQNAFELPRFFDHAHKILPEDRFAIALQKLCAVGALLDQVFFHRGLILEIDLGFATHDFVERRLGDVEISAFDQFGHLAVEEREQQRADVRAIHVGVRHDYDLMVAQFRDVEFIPSDPGSQRHHEVADFLAAQHSVEARAFDVQDLTLERQNGLSAAVASGLG